MTAGLWTCRPYCGSIVFGICTGIIAGVCLNCLNILQKLQRAKKYEIISTNVQIM